MDFDSLGAVSGLLSMVGTPIGNLGDGSPRMKEVLDSSDLVLCEDTRVTARLMSAYGISAKLERCDDNVIKSKVAEVLRALRQGMHISFVSDAGMPGISDPGAVLVDAVLDAGFKVEVIPGPSAVTCALVASGFSIKHFFFEGFLTRKKTAQTKRLQALAQVPGALVLYESPMRVTATLQTIAEVFPKRRVALVREITKLHEEVVRGLAPDLYEQIAARESVKGECVIVIDAPKESNHERVVHSINLAEMHRQTLEEAILEGLAQARPKTALARQLSKRYGKSRNEVYDLVCDLARKGD